MKMGSPTQTTTSMDVDHSVANHSLGIAFSARLNTALDRAGIPKLNKGRQVAVKQKMRVSQEAVRKWLSGESIPRHSRLIQLSHWLDVSYGWLISGQQDEISEPHQPYQSNHHAIPFYPLNPATPEEFFPLDMAASLTTERTAFLFSEWSDQDAGVFAFEINDELMQPTYRLHDIVLINTQTTPSSGQTVLVVETTQLRVRRLKELHPHYAVLTTDNPDQPARAEFSLSESSIRILGVVTRLLRTEKGGA